jgi:hypothetical protein
MRFPGLARDVYNASDGRAGFVRGRCPMLVDEDAARIAAATAELVRDPRELLMPHVDTAGSAGAERIAS